MIKFQPKEEGTVNVLKKWTPEADGSVSMDIEGGTVNIQPIDIGVILAMWAQGQMGLLDSNDSGEWRLKVMAASQHVAGAINSLCDAVGASSEAREGMLARVNGMARMAESKPV